MTRNTQERKYVVDLGGSRGDGLCVISVEATADRDALFRLSLTSYFSSRDSRRIDASNSQRRFFFLKRANVRVPGCKETKKKCNRQTSGIYPRLVAVSLTCH